MTKFKFGARNTNNARTKEQAKDGLEVNLILSVACFNVLRATATLRKA
jgi:hypothetical protein